jgi:hypothetical protein
MSICRTAFLGAGWSLVVRGFFARAARGADEEEDSLVLEEEDALELPESAAAD